MSIKAYRYAIIGLGKTGLSVARFLQRIGASFFACDTRSAAPETEALAALSSEIPLFLGTLSLEQLRMAETLILSPGISPADPVLLQAASEGIPIIGDVELFCRYNTVPILAITGSNGKGTVTTLIEEMGKAAGVRIQAAGNIGLPVCDCLSKTDIDYFVLELSSFQLEVTQSLSAEVATVLNVTPDHLDRHKTLERYAAIKRSIYDRAAVRVYEPRDLLARPAGETLASDRLVRLVEPQDATAFGIRYIDDIPWLAQGVDNILPVTEMKIRGSHNWQNALTALAFGIAIGLPISAMQTALRTFPGLHYRCEWVAEHKGVNWYNDSKGTNIGACIAAIEGLSAGANQKLILIAGGQGKGQDFALMRKTCAAHVAKIILFGEDAEALSAALSDVVSTEQVADLPTAVLRSGAIAEAGQVVLFSPACASFDMFKSYEHRGAVFTALVKDFISL